MVVDDVLLRNLIKMSDWDAIRVAEGKVASERVSMFDSCGQAIKVEVVVEIMLDKVSELLSLLEGVSLGADGLGLLFSL